MYSSWHYLICCFAWIMMDVYGIMYMFITRTQLLSYIFQQLYTWLYIALKTEWLECLYSRHYTVKMAVSQRFKIEVLSNILPAGEEIESDTQQSADDTMVTVGENMGTMLFKPHLIVSKHCCLKSNSAIYSS